MQDTTTKRPDARTIQRRWLAMLVLAVRYGADAALAGGAEHVRELVHQRQAVGQ